MMTCTKGTCERSLDELPKGAMRSHRCREAFIADRTVSTASEEASSWLERADWATYRSRMVQTARRILQNDDDAEDAAQDAIVAALSTRHPFRSQSLPTTWLHRIVTNVCRMQRRASIRHSTTSLSSCDDLDDCLRTQGRLAEDAHDIDVECNDPRCLLPLVQRLIQKLPHRLAQVLVLRDVEHYDTQTTAHQLRITPNAVKTRLHRARQLLRAMVARELRLTAIRDEKTCNLSDSSASNSRTCSDHV